MTYQPYLPQKIYGNIGNCGLRAMYQLQGPTLLSTDFMAIENEKECTNPCINKNGNIPVMSEGAKAFGPK